MFEDQYYFGYQKLMTNTFIESWLITMLIDLEKIHYSKGELGRDILYLEITEPSLIEVKKKEETTTFNAYC